MDYTVIGDEVNLASRLEGLTKHYSQSLIFSASIQEQVAGEYECRLLDRVVVKGKSKGIGIYTAKQSLGADEARAWTANEEGMKAYFDRDFATATSRFRRVLELLPEDVPAAILIARCAALLKDPPSKDWTGAAVMSEK